MLEGFEPPVFSSSPRTGRPPKSASAHLRNLSWLRFLLRSLDDVERWALDWRKSGGKAAGTSSLSLPAGDAVGIPTTWHARHLDAETLGGFFSASGRAPLPSDLARSPALLDDVFGALFAGPESGGGRYFADRVVRGLVSPDATRLQRLDDLVPGSRKAFEQEPGEIDRWFYDAFDFTNPWFAKLYLWRAADPYIEDPGWDLLVTATSPWPEMPTLRGDVREQLHAPYALTDRDRASFESLIENAVAITVQPSLAKSPAHELYEARARLPDAGAASSSSTATHPVAVAVARMENADRWVALSNAVAGCRLARLIDLPPALTAWWLRGVCAGMADDIREAQQRLYCSMPRSKPTLEAVLQPLWRVQA
jgi:hypothetical protein